MKPLTIEPLMDQEVQNLSGGELQVGGGRPWIISDNIRLRLDVCEWMHGENGREGRREGGRELGDAEPPRERAAGEGGGLG